MATTAEGIQSILDQYGTFITQHCGDIPSAIVAARIWAETQGNPCPKPTACCDEQGLLQLWPDTRTRYGVTDACDPDQNIRGGCAHWLAEIAGLRNVLAQQGVTPDEVSFWKFADLYTAIGAGATAWLIQQAGIGNYDAFVTWTQEKLFEGALDAWVSHWGTQSSDTIAKRVLRAGQRVDAALTGSEISVGGLGGLGGVLLGAAVGFGIWWWFRSRR